MPKLVYPHSHMDEGQMSDLRWILRNSRPADELHGPEKRRWRRLRTQIVEWTESFLFPEAV